MVSEENSKKVMLLGIFAVFLVLSFLVFVSADVQGGGTAESPTQVIVGGLRGAINAVQEIGKPLFEALLGETGLGAEGNVTFPKILVFFLVVLVVMAVLDISTVPLFSGPQKVFYRFAIGVIVAILGVRYLPTNLIHQLALPSSALAAAITMLIPFIIFFFIVENSFSSSIAKRFAWIVYSVLLFALWIYNFNKPWAWIYFAIIAACGVMFFFDPVLIKLRNKMRNEARAENLNDYHYRQLLTQLDRLYEQREALLKSDSNDSWRQLSKVNSQIQRVKNELERYNNS